MKISIKVMVVILMTICLTFLFKVTEVLAVTSIIFNGSDTPEEHGWIREYQENIGSITIITESGGEIADKFYASTSGAAVNYYTYTTGFDEFFVSMRVEIHGAAFNLHDGGFTFSPIGREPWPYTDRYLSLYIDDSEIGFQDFYDSYPLDATSFHEYSILYRDGYIRVYLDETYNDILDETATPILIREIPVVHPDNSPPNGWDRHVVGMIVFGDTSNDNIPEEVNSTYTLDYIIFEGFPVVPTIDDIIDFIHDHEDIVGVGPGKSAINKYNAFMNMLLTAADLIEAGDIEGACGQLNSIMKKM